MKTAWFVAAALTIGAGAWNIRAADEAPASPASQPASAPRVLQATDTDAIKAAKDTDATVEGVIESAEWSSSGKVLVIRFKGTEFSGAAFSRIREKLDKAFSGDVARTLTGAKVRLKGTIGEYKEKPQIVISQTTQITILEPGEGSAASQPGK
jgi:hypothetical protein